MLFCRQNMRKIMKQIYIMIFAVLAVGLMGCDYVSSVFNSDKEALGAYSKQRRLTAEQESLFYSVTESLGDRVEYTPMNVGVQVVAGTNYRFLCKGREKNEDGSKGEKIYAEIVIHQPLPGQGEAKIISISRQKR